GGVLQQFGTPAEIYRRPANRVVASFIGTPAMAFVAGEAALIDGAPSLTIAGQPVAALAALPADRRITIGIRAEDVRIGDRGVPARIGLVEPIGHEIILRL